MDIKNLHSVGEKTAKLLNKLDIYTDYDLINFYPYKYNVYNFDTNIRENDNLILNVIIESNPITSFIRKNFNKMTFRANFNGMIFYATIFNRAYLSKNLQIGKKVTLIGKFDLKKKAMIVSDIKFNIINRSIEPIYHLVKGISSSQIFKIIKENFDNIQINDYLPENYINKYHLMNLKNALYNIHFASDLKNASLARNRIVYEELFNFSFKMNYLKSLNNKHGKLPKNIDNDKINEFINLLPFKLTIDQQKAAQEIINELSQEKRMNRLILGDVGSGKTIIATISIYANYLAGYESTLMAPTEVLALQHYFSIKKILDKYDISIEIITGSMTKKEKEKIYERVKNNEIDLLIGTHSLLNENVIFNNLGLVITDEQHRFGVNQRFMLKEKSKNPDILYLSATPIPRTYALTIYGDLDISYIKTKPFGRKEIITKILKFSEIKILLANIYEQIKLSHQVYIVCPLVEYSDENELSSVKKLKEQFNVAFKNMFRVEIIHGKMKSSEKDAIMNDFKNNQIKILISTTVIEVGIDVPNATVMAIFNAERFGLATLHQLRGRVGRNDLQSYCFLISDVDNERLNVMIESNDGFYISQKDFEIRGHGDLFGVRQHGDMSFKLANLKMDYNILTYANMDSKEYLESKKYLDNDYYKKVIDEFNITD